MRARCPGALARRASQVISDRVTGELTIKDVIHEIEVEATVEGAAEDPWGRERVGIAVRGMIDRTEFGLTWQQPLRSGGMLVGEQVALRLDISAVRAVG
jgi:polyisoprenoid-binding protein YceI